MNIDEWVEDGSPYIHPQLRPNCSCNALLEHQHPPAVAAAFFEQCQGCRAQYIATAGLAYDPTAGGFAGAGYVASPTAYVPRVRTRTPTPVPTAPTVAEMQAAARQEPQTWGAITTPIPGGDRGLITPPSGPMIHPTQPSGETTVNSFITGGATGLATSPIMPAAPSQSLWGGITGAVGGFLTGGIPGAVVGGLSGLVGDSGGQAPCPPGYERRNGQCVTPVPGAGGFVERVLPGGASGYETAAGVPTEATTVPVATTTYRCPRGYVMHVDGYCAKKPVSMKDRMYPYHRPALSYGDMKAIRRAARLKKRMVKLTKQTGAWASNSKPSPRRVAASPPMRQLGPGPSIINVE